MNNQKEVVPMTKLAEVRKAKHLSQSQLAAKLGVDRQTIYRYEAGMRSPSIPMLYKLAHALDCKIIDII